MNQLSRPIRDRLHGLTLEIAEARRRHPRLTLTILTAFAAAAALPVAVSLWLVFALARGLPDGDALRRIGEMDQATSIYDRNDRVAFTVFRERRLEIPLSGMSPHLVRALVSVEDQRFYDHRGFDTFRTLSAAVANLRHRRAAQGGSTITQQLARQSFLKPDKTVRRKLQELILAGRIEQAFSKSKILELYLNKVYFGDGYYGVEAASRGYFGKAASDLAVGEAALLAGVVKAPTTYAPTSNLERATARRNLVLQAMLDSGEIDRATWAQARASRIELAPDALARAEPHGQYFKEEVRQELVERFGSQRVYQGGLRVFTTIDMDMQRSAEAAVQEQLAALGERRKAFNAKRKQPADPQPLQAAFLAMDPATGEVRAMVGGRDFNESRFNRAVQARRQPGSAFKPFVYAAALESGYSPATVLTNLDDPIATVRGAWTPEDEHSTAGAMSLRTALRTSSNRAAVKLLQIVGIDRTVQYAKGMGIADVPSVPSLALGSGEVTLEAMTAAYAAFANRGLVPEPILIRRVEDRDGRVLVEQTPSTSRAISETTAFLMTTMLADVVNAGTGARARRLGFTLPAAGKTGTTNDFNDAWFIGFTPKLAAGVWVGFDQPHTILPNGFAADVAVPVWATFMKEATAGDKPDWYAPPPGIVPATVCRISGKLATEDCGGVEVTGADGRTERRSMVYTEYFTAGTEPVAFCDAHTSQNVFGKIAAFFGAAPEKPAASEIPLTPSSTLGTTLNTALGTIGHVDTPPLQRQSKRGFWGRLFGGGGEDQTNGEDQKPRNKKR